MFLYKNISELVTLKGVRKKHGRYLAPEDLSIIKNGAIAFDENNILWVGDSNEIPFEYLSLEARDLSGHTVTPGLVDSHTHLVFGGNRSFEYSMRLDGESYENIANAGGGILYTMKQTNESSQEELFKIGVQRVERLLFYGIKILEIKSGYGLNYEKEKELTLLIDKLKVHFKGKIVIFNTFLAAHAVPKDFSSSTEYLNKVVIPLLEELAPLGVIDAVDIFHEQGYFNEEDTKALFRRAKELGIARKLHADEFYNNGGAQLAVEFEALSCDHLLKTGKEGIQYLSKGNTVATILPGTAFFLGEELANARLMLDAGVQVALASDYNPGSCHCDNLPLIASFAAKNLKMNRAEIWASLTYNGACALGLGEKTGSIEVNCLPIFSIFKTKNLSDVTYYWGRNFYEE